MRISTTQIFERPRTLMATLSSETDAIQTQIATGKRFSTPSGDAPAYRQLAGIRQASADDATYAANITTAQGLIAQSDSALSNIETQIQRAQELALQAGNGTLPDAGRQAIAAELDGVIDVLYSLANSKDTQGHPLFGGADGGVPYSRDASGTISYVGTGTPSGIPVGDGATIRTSETGDRVFDLGGTDVFALLQGLSAALKSGTGVDAAQSAAVDGIGTAVSQIATVHASIGARAARLEVESNRLTSMGEAREEARTALEDTDVSTAVVELQKKLTVLQATQASFTKLSNLSLFDYLR